ncbi:hypothetical protein [Senegalimassilia anaerobia]|uniref:hypothetical protein n=1 Tax=Senegalimassilia anaerobia TaxID=1473216 RepID=UPI003A8FC59C
MIIPLPRAPSAPFPRNAWNPLPWARNAGALPGKNRNGDRRRKRKFFAIARKAGQKRGQPKKQLQRKQLQRTANAVASC